MHREWTPAPWLQPGTLGTSFLYMRLKNRQMIILLLSCLLLVVAGCETDVNTDPVLPGEMTLLVISFSPSPVYESSNGEFQFLVFVDELNNVGATISVITLETLDEDGSVLDEEDHDEDWVRRTFGSSYIEPYGRLISSVEVETYSGHRQNWILRGTDDRGNSFKYTQSVELIPR